jgi:hypothetical protein
MYKNARDAKVVVLSAQLPPKSYCQMVLNVSEHEKKATILWTSFRDRLGDTTRTVVPEEILSLVQNINNLQELSVNFSEEEIDKVVASLPIDKAPEPDGFNGQFLKSCWRIIKFDFYNICSDFHDGLVSLQSINDSFIALIPKKIPQRLQATSVQFLC